MFGVIRSLHDALTSLTSSVEALRDSVATARDWHETHGHVEARVEELERQRTLFEADVTGELLKARTEYLKAASAEGRARTAAKAQESDDGADESFEELAAAYRAWTEGNDGAAGKIEGMQHLPERVEAEASIVDTLRARKWRR